ncbi:MAG: methyltransferase domain-containing protein [Planctomycetes bacterium]|nr:methyltransferase domain-containing protein [Planctomycetota bacterium]
MTTPAPECAAEPTVEWVDCYACGSKDHEELLWSRDRLHRLPGRFRVVRCRDCDLVFLNPRLTREAILAYYPPSYPMNQFRPAEPADPLRRRLVARHLARMDRIKIRTVRRHAKLGPGSRVLDVGCGLGSFLAELSRRTGCRAVGVEPAPVPCRFAREKYGLEVHEGLLEDFEFEAGSFDAITLWHVLEHQFDVKKTLGTLAGLLALGGKLVVESPDFSDPLARVFGGFWCNLELPRHLIHFTPRTISRVLEDSGFAVESLRRGGAMPPCSVFLASLFAVFRATYDRDLVKTAYLTQAVWALTWPLFALEGVLTGRGVMTCVARAGSSR